MNILLSVLRKEGRKEGMVFYPDVRCLVTAFLSCLREHESEDGLVFISIGGPCA